MGAFNGSGTFIRSYSWVTDAANGIKIRADRMDTEDDGFATNGLTLCVTRNGQSPWTANLPAGGHKITGLADGSAATDSASLAQVQSGISSFVAITGTDTYAAAPSPTVAAYADGLTLGVRFANANATVTPTLNVSTLGAIGLKDADGGALSVGDITAGLETIARYITSTGKFNLLTLNGNLRVIGQQNITTTATFTPTAGTKFIIARLKGGGAGGRTQSSGNFGGGGGGAGEDREGVFTAAQIGASQTATVGAGGAVDSAGGTTSLGALLTAVGGSPGGSDGHGGIGGTGGTGTGAANPGENGQNGSGVVTTNQVYGGNGGGGGGLGGFGLLDHGTAGVRYGSGGGGNGFASATWSNAAAGKKGYLEIIEFG